MALLSNLSKIEGGTYRYIPEGMVEVNLLGALRMYDESPDPPRPESEYTHVSSLTKGACARAMALQHKYGLSAPEPVPSGMRILWAIGRCVEHHIRTALIAAYPKQAYGLWVCGCGEGYKEPYQGVAEDAYTKTCPHCGKVKRHYRELTLFDDEFGIAGNPDLLLLTPDGMLVIEIKSANAKGFAKAKDRMETTADYAGQVLMYRRILIRLGFKVCGETRVIYGRKEYMPFKQPYLEIPVMEEDFDYKAKLNMMEITAKSINDMRKAGYSVTDRLPCCESNGDCKVAKACSARAVCLSVGGS